MRRLSPGGANLESALLERHVQAVWYDAKWRPRRLATRTGSEIRVVDPGRWNGEAGPDFLDATLEIGPRRERLRGDVEVHLRPGDWDAHRHGDDPAYRNVVAHVTWAGGPEPATLPPGAISVWLGRFMAEQTGFSPGQIDLDAYPFACLPLEARPCALRISAVPPDAVHALLAAAGRRRIEEKALRLRRRLREDGEGAMQVLYEATLCALGYGRQTEGMRAMSALVPYAMLLGEPENARAAMVAAAPFVFAPARCGRPANDPRRRIAAAADLAGSGVLEELAAASDFTPAGCRRLIGRMVESRRMGRGRAGAVLANVVLPWAMATGRWRGEIGWLPPEDVSAPVRLTAYRLFGRDHNPAGIYAGNNLFIQGLLHIHRIFCRNVHPDCAGCALGEAEAWRISV